MTNRVQELRLARGWTQARLAEELDVSRSSVREAIRTLSTLDIVDVRLKRIDFVPEISESVFRRMEAELVRDAVLHVSITRPRPVVIALSRDLSAYSKRNIHQEVTRLMPGLFISLSSTANMGIDIHSMQQVLDSPERAATLGRAARRFVVAGFSWQAHLSGIDACLETPGATIAPVEAH